MRWPIRNQILFPFVTVSLLSVGLIAISSALWAARRAERDLLVQVNRVIQTLGDSHYPYSPNVLAQVKGFSGAEFITLDRRGQRVDSTLPVETQFAAESLASFQVDEVSIPQLTSLADQPTILLNETRYFVATVRRDRSVGVAETVLVLYPEQRLATARQQAAGPPLVIGLLTLPPMVLVSLWLANRWSKRIRSVEQQVAAIAQGDFGTISLSHRQDEIQDLAVSVNRMSAQLSQMQTAIQQSERSRILGQLAGGLAHQLRNAVTGANLAVQIHQKRCGAGDDDSLDVALRQLSLMEEQIKGMLSLGQNEQRPVKSQLLTQLLGDVESLVKSACEHAQVQWAIRNETPSETEIPDSERLRTALLNLVLNAIEAAGPQGEVSVSATCELDSVTLAVIDSGPGPDPAIVDQLWEPFVTGKQEGVGLGLTLVQHMAEGLRGKLEWRRDHDRTIFTLTCPIPRPGASVLVGPTSESEEVS